MFKAKTKSLVRGPKAKDTSRSSIEIRVNSFKQADFLTTADTTTTTTTTTNTTTTTTFEQTKL